MVQVLPPVERKPSTSEQIAEAFGKIGSGIASSYLEKSRMKAENEKAKEYGFDMTGITDPKARAEIWKQIAKSASRKDMWKELGLAEEFGGAQKPTENVSEPVRSDVENVKGEINVGEVKVPTRKLIPESKILKAESFREHAIAQQMRAHNENIITQQRHEEKMESQAVTAARKETMPLRKDYADKAKYAKEAVKNKQQQLNLIKKGQIDSPERVYMASLLPGALGNKLLSADTQLYRAGLFEEFGVLKNMFPGQIRVKEIELLEDKLASLEKSDEAKEKILETGIAKLEIPQIKAKAAQRVEREYPKATLLEFEDLVDQYAHDDLEKAYNRISDAYEKIYFDYAPEQSNLIDQNGQVYHNIPKNLLRSFYDEGMKEGLVLKPI